MRPNNTHEVECQLDFPMHISDLKNELTTSTVGTKAMNKMCLIWSNRENPKRVYFLLGAKRLHRSDLC